MQIKLALSVGLILITLAATGCSERPSSRANADSPNLQPPPSELQLKREILSRQGSRPRALPLTVAKIYPRVGQEDRAGLDEAFFVRYWPGRGIIMSSGRLRRLSLLDEAFSAHTPWSERLPDPPSNIEVLPDGLAVDLAGRIQFLDEQGRLGHSFSVFLDIYDLEVGLRGEVWVNANLTPIPSQRALLLRLDRSGRRTGSAGTRSDESQWRGMLDNVFLAAGGERLAAVHARLPLMRIFDARTGRETASVELAHPVFGQLARAFEWPYHDEANQSLLSPRYAAGAAQLEDRIYVLLHLPYVEVIEFSWDGRELGRWRLDDLGFEAYDYSGFDVRRSPQGLRWLTSVVHRYQREGAAFFQPRVIELAAGPEEGSKP